VVDPVRQAVKDWHISKRKAVKGFFKREWPIIAFIVCFSLIAVGIFQVQSFQDELRDSAVAGCERQNEVRKAVRMQLTSEIRETRRIDYSELFPTIPPTQIDRLISEGNEQARRQRAAIPDADCEALYPTD
jgi:hypothetical protein